MDYSAVLKKSWNITWRYRILWLFGLFAGAGGGGSFNWNSGSSSGRGSGSTGLPGNMSTAQMTQLLERYAVVILIGVLFLIVLAVLMLIVSIAARGGLIHLVNEAEEKREVRAGAGWHVGFSKWWRVFGVGFLADLPLAVMALVFGVFFAIAAIGALAASRGSGASIGTALSAAVGGAFVGLCFFGFIFFIAAVVLGTIFSIVKELAVRYVVIEDRRVMDALKTAWRDLWAKRGAFVMYLIMIGVGIAYGIVVAIVAALMVVPAALMIAFGNWVGGAALILFAGLILIVPSAIYSTFYHTVWTVFFRAMTGVAPLPKPVVGYPVAPPAPTMVPPAPPAAPEPPAAHVPPEPSAPHMPPAEPAFAPEPGPTPEPPAGDDA
jgi:hypothetical protein